MTAEIDISSLTDDNLKIVKSFIERAYEGYNLLPNERPVRVHASVADYDDDQRAIKYLQKQGVITSYTQSNSHFPAYYYIEVELEKFMELYNNLAEKSPAATTAVLTPVSIRFVDSENPILMWDSVPVSIPKNSLPYWILQKLFEEYPNAVEVDDVLGVWGGNEKGSTVSDGVGLVNKRIRNALGVKKVKLALVGQSDSYFRFTDEYIESISTDK